MQIYSTKLDITKYTAHGSKDYIGPLTTALLVKKALDGLSIDLRDQFCFVNELEHSERHYVVITATDQSLVDEVIYWFEKFVNDYNLTMSAKNFLSLADYYNLSA